MAILTGTLVAKPSVVWFVPAVMHVSQTSGTASTFRSNSGVMLLRVQSQIIIDKLGDENKLLLELKFLVKRTRRTSRRLKCTLFDA